MFCRYVCLLFSGILGDHSFNTDYAAIDTHPRNRSNKLKTKYETIRFTDLLSLFVGESLGLRLPGVANKKYRNVCPCFYSGRASMQCGRRELEVATKLNGMMDERFTIFRSGNPLPLSQRDKSWPQCGKCAAAFYLGADLPVGSSVVQVSNAPSQGRPAEGPRGIPDWVAALEALAVLRCRGDIDAAEYAEAKKKLLAQ